MNRLLFFFSAALVLWVVPYLRAELCNVKVVTDASPDYSDMPSLVRSITDCWTTPAEKCWAVYYWNHIARRQTAPMILHGLELTDPIRQFNDYGYTMCSTISGINCGIWQHMGLQARFWDISLHTVPEVFYEGRWRMYDNSMSALYTLCDGHTLAGVEDIGKTGACALSGDKFEPGHIARYHCLYGTGPNGFLTGADTQRSLDEEAHCFNTNALKHRNYYFNWDYGHRYILNLKNHESYTRYYQSRGSTPGFYVPNDGKDPDDRYHLRGNGLWNFHPDLTNPKGAEDLYSFRNVAFGENGAQPLKATEPVELIFKVEAANVITSQHLRAKFNADQGGGGQARLFLSTNNGLRWAEIWKSPPGASGAVPVELSLVEQVNGAYEVLIKAQLEPENGVSAFTLQDFNLQTVTMLNAKTQPRLNLGANTVFVGAGEQTDSIVFWPELQRGKYQNEIVAEQNIASAPKHPGYQGAVYPAKAREDAFLVYRIDAPRDLTAVTLGGRFYNHAPKSHIELLYSLDGQSWTQAWSLTNTSPPWDVIHYEAVKIAPSHRSVWIKYLMNSSEASPGGCSIYALRLEAHHLPAHPGAAPLQVTFNWSEPRPDRSLVERSHTQTIDRLPFKYRLNVGGADHPVINWVRVNSPGSVPDLKEGYSDGRDAGGQKLVPRWLTVGHNLALGKPYSLSKPSRTNWGAGDDGRKLTSGACAPSYAGGTSYKSGALWNENENPAVTVDLGQLSSCASFGMNFHGYPWWDALKGEIKDQVEVLTSADDNTYASQGYLKTDLRWIDLPVNYMWPDDETITSATFRLVPKAPIQARYVKYQITNKRFFDCAGLEVLDSIKSEPFDLRIALPE